MIQAFLRTIKRYEMKYMRFAALYAFLAAIAAVSNILSTRAASDMMQSADLGISEDMMGFLIVAAAAGVINVLANGLSALLRQNYLGRASHAIRSVFARRLLFLRYKDFALKNSGEGASLFTNDVPQAATFVAIQTLSQITQITTLIASAVFMAWINWWLTLLYFALFPLLAAFQAKLSAPIGKKRLEASERRAEFNAVVTDAFQNPLTIKAYGLEASVEGRFDQSYTQFADANYASAKTHAKLALVGICATVVPMFMLWMAASAEVIAGNMQISEFIALTIVSGPVGNWLTMFAQDLAQMRRTSASAIRLLEYAPDAMDQEDDVISIHPSDACAVAFENVVFGYTDASKALDGTTFSIQKGTVTAIAGESGCGKSTILKLMLSLYRPQSGEIRLASENVSYVPQDCYLLPVSIKENIVCGLPMDEDQLRMACENAGIYDFIQSLPDGFDSVLSESASNVSGGQKQRIAMARAFYRDAELLLLDEATSALDPATEKAVLDAFYRYVKANGKTAVVVAHRQAVLDMSDCVIRLSKGGAKA